MLKQEILLLFVCLLSFSYLAYFYSSNSTEIHTKSEFLNELDNENINLCGNISNLKIFEEYTLIYINEIECKLSSTNKLIYNLESNKLICVEGLKKSYMNRSWIQISIIKYDN
jgi:hypothetical protein